MSLRMESLTVSVIIPTRNRLILLQRAIESILSQTYKDFEIIVVDDDSDDSTSDVCRKYIEQYENIKYIRNKKYVGGAEARNIGMHQARGNIIAFLDDDDEWLPQKLEKQIEVFHNNPSVGIVGSNYLWIDTDNNKIEKKDVLKKQSFKTLLIDNTLGSFSFISIKKELFDKYGGIRTDMKSAQDWNFWLKLAPHTQIYIVEDYLVKYYDYSGNPDRISSSIDRAVESLKKIIEDFQDDMSFFVKLKHKLWMWQRKNFIYDKFKSRYIKSVTNRFFRYPHDSLLKILKLYYFK